MLSLTAEVIGRTQCDREDTIPLCLPYHLCSVFFRPHTHTQPASVHVLRTETLVSHTYTASWHETLSPRDTNGIIEKKIVKVKTSQTKKTTTETILAHVFLCWHSTTTTRRHRPVFSCCWLRGASTGGENRPASWGSDGLINIMLFSLFWTKISWCLSICWPHQHSVSKRKLICFVFTQYWCCTREDWQE